MCSCFNEGTAGSSFSNEFLQVIVLMADSVRIDAEEMNKASQTDIDDEDQQLFRDVDIIDFR